MPIPALIQSNTNTSAAATTVTVSLGTASTPGNTYLAYGFARGSGAFTLSCADPSNGSYVVDITNGGVAPISCGIFRVSGVSGGQPTVTLTCGSTPTNMAIILEEWSGLQLSNPLDRTAAAANNSGTTTPSAGSSGALAIAGELAVAFAPLAAAVTWTAGAGWTFDQTTGSIGRGLEYQITPNASAVTGNFTISASQPWNALLATYIPAVSVDTLLGQGWV